MKVLYSVIESPHSYISVTLNDFIYNFSVGMNNDINSIVSFGMKKE